MGAHALLIGVSRFDDPKLAKLNSPQSDVAAFASVLKDPSRGAFESVTVSVDEDLLTIRDQLSALLDGRSADDMVLFYYSGHGIMAKGQRLYLATGQSSFDKPQPRSLATSEIRDMMEQSRAGRLVVILDCCHSGVFAEGAKGAAATVTDETFGSGDGAEGQYVLTASDGLQYAYDGAGMLKEAKPGPALSRFTSWLVEGLAKGEASPFDEQITLDSLYQYLCRRARAEGNSMTPQRFVKRGSGELVIAKNPMAKVLALPEPVMANLDSTDWKVRKAAIGELGKLAKQTRMGPLVKNAVLDRVSDERDVDVREAMVTLLQRLGVGPQPGAEPVASEKSVRLKQPEPQPVKPAPAHQPEPIRPPVAPFVSSPAPLYVSRRVADQGSGEEQSPNNRTHWDQRSLCVDGASTTHERVAYRDLYVPPVYRGVHIFWSRCHRTGSEWSARFSHPHPPHHDRVRRDRPCEQKGRSALRSAIAE